MSTPVTSSTKPKPKPKLQTHTSSHSIRSQAASSSSTPAKQGAGRDNQASTSTLPGGAGANLKGDSKTVYKALLESPSLVRWPTLPSHLQQTFLHTLLDQIIPLAYPLSAAPFRRPSTKKGKGKRRELRTEEELLNDELVEAEEKKKDESGLVVGLNACSKMMLPSPLSGGAGVDEGGAGGSKKRKRNNDDDLDADDGSAAAPPSTEPPSSSSTPTILVLFVCLQDIVPQQLVAHLPAMVAASNARGGETRVVCLPVGSEAVLAAKIGVRRVGCLGVLSSFPSQSTLSSLISLLPPPLIASHLSHLPKRPLVPPPASTTTRPPQPKPAASNASPTSKPPPSKKPKTVVFTAPSLTPTSASASTSQLLSTQRTPALPASSKPTDKATFKPLSLKILKTTTPADPKGRRVERTKGVKEKRKEKKEKGVGKGRPVGNGAGKKEVGGKVMGEVAAGEVVEKGKGKGKAVEKMDVKGKGKGKGKEEKVAASEMVVEMGETGAEKPRKIKNRGVKRRRGGKAQAEGAGEGEGEGAAEAMVVG